MPQDPLKTAPGRPDSGWSRATESLQNEQFKRVFIGNMAFFLAMGGQGVVRPWIAYQLTDSALSLGIVSAAMAIPMFFISPLGGALADRVERRGLIMTAQTLAILTELIVLGLFVSDRIEFWHLVVAAASLGCSFPLMMPARSAIVYALVGRRHLGAAMGLNMTGMNATRVLGPALAGFLIAAIGVTGAYVVDLVLYGIALASMFTVQRLPPPEAARLEPLLSNITGGFKYLLEDRFVSMLLLFGLLPQFLVMPFMTMIPVFAEKVWMTGPEGVGILSAAVGMGAVLGSFYVAGRSQDMPRLRLMMLSAITFSLFLAAFAWSPFFWPAVVLSLFANVGASIFSTLNNVAIQLVIPDEVRGRVSSFLMMSVSLPLLGSLPMGWIADKIGAPAAVGASSLLAVVAVLLFYVLSPALRNLDERVKAKSESI